MVPKHNMIRRIFTHEQSIEITAWNGFIVCMVRCHRKYVVSSDAENSITFIGIGGSLRFDPFDKKKYFETTNQQTL